MKKIIWITFLLLVSCAEVPNKNYYKNGNLRVEHFLNEDNQKDSSVYYHDSRKPQVKKIIKRLNNGTFEVVNYNLNGKITGRGLKNKDSKRLGKWFSYSKDTTEIFEYKTIKGREYLNQSWLISKGDTIGGNYYLSMETVDTIDVNEMLSLRFYLEGFLFSKDSDFIFVLPEFGEEFNEDFSNETVIDTDTIRSLKYDDLNKHLKNLPLNHILISNLVFSTPGQKQIRGILKELHRPENDSVRLEERSIYYEKEVYVRNVDNE